MARIDSFLRLVADQRASDLHFHAGTVPMIRHDGSLVPLPFRNLTAEETRRFLFEIMTPDQRARFEERLDLDFAYEIRGLGRFRVNAYMQHRGPGGVFRVIPEKVPSVEDLGLPRSLKKLAALQNGLVLVTGPTGSGKTTTLAALIREINASSERHVITVEDPIEYIHDPIRSLVTQREVGRHTETFASALRAALRESPDVLVVGELRDAETVMLALAAAETGALVFGTLHTNSAAKSVDRMLDLCPDESQAQARGALSTLLRGVVAQQLVRRAGGEGMAAAIEVLLPSWALSHMIRENKIHQIDGYIQQHEAEGSGMQTMDGALARLVRQGQIDLDAALRVARNPDLFRRTSLQEAED